MSRSGTVVFVDSSPSERGYFLLWGTGRGGLRGDVHCMLRRDCSRFLTVRRGLRKDVLWSLGLGKVGRGCCKPHPEAVTQDLAET